jgi:hypothetical protein
VEDEAVLSTVQRKKIQKNPSVTLDGNKHISTPDPVAFAHFCFGKS